VGPGAPQPVQAGVDHDAVQPTANRGVMPKGTAPRCAESIALCNASSASSGLRVVSRASRCSCRWWRWNNSSKV
jgi:hypothetical protein